MAKKVRLEVEIENSMLEETTDGFVRLERQIKETRIELQKAAEMGDTVKFNQLKGQLDELEDGLEKVRFQSKEFHDALATVPGPAGKVGTAIQGLDSAFKMLLANPIIAVIAGIAGMLMLMYKALNSTAEGQAALKKMTDAAYKALAPLLALVEKVAVPVFTAFADAISWVATKLEDFAIWLGVSEKKIKEAYGNINEDEKKRLEEQKKREEEAKKQREEQAKKDLEELKKGLEDAKKALMTAQEKEIYEVQEKYKKLYNLHNASKEQLALLKKAEAKELTDIRTKYTDEEIKASQEFVKKLGEISTASIKDEQLRTVIAREQKYKEDLLNLEKDKEFIKMDEDTKNVYRFQLKEAFENDLEKTKKTWAEQEIARNKQITQSYIDLASNLATTFNNTAQLMEKGSTAAKIFGVLSVVSNAAAGIGTAIIKNQEAQAAYNKTIAEGTAGLASAGILLSNPLTAALGVAQAAASKVAIATATAGKAASKVNMGIQIGAITAASAAQIAAIMGGTKASASGGSAAGSDSGAPASVSNIGMGALPAPTIGGSVTNNNQQLAGMIGSNINQNQQPIKAYVLASDVKTADQFDRRVLQASKL